MDSIDTYTQVFLLLYKLEAEFPPPPKCHHSLTLMLHEGELRLALGLWTTGCKTFFLEHTDFDDADKVVEFIRNQGYAHG